MEQEFTGAYTRLNDAQREAVDAIEGPVLVVAGPGTGKTQLLSLRVANILQKTDSDPGSILCLTFTNFAATNMRDRLTKLVGPSARNTVVRTFHSFAADIMSLYPEYFWSGARLSIAPDAVQLEIVQNILAGLPLDNPLALKFAGSYTALHDVQQALKLTKEAGLTPGKLAAMLSVNEAYLDIIEPQLSELLTQPLSMKKLPDLMAAINALPDQAIGTAATPLRSLSDVFKESLAVAVEADGAVGKTTRTGKWKRRWLQTIEGQRGMFDERRRNAWWQAVVGVYDAYRIELHNRGYYDYADMIIEVITQLEQHPELLASVQERFLYVLIDEFQDTNAAQLRLAHLVAANPANADRPNLMAVGDDDQTIFAFNGAELNNMLAFRHTYPATRLIVLHDNYRSNQAILDTAQEIIEQADDRLVKREPGLNKFLQAATEPGSGVIEHYSYPTRAHQFSATAHRIQQSWAADSAQSLVVLARSHDSLVRLSALLNKLQVPIRYEKQNNILDHEVISQVCLLAETVIAIADGDEETTNHHLALLLRHPMWRVPPSTLWELALRNYSSPHWLQSLLEQTDEHLPAIGHWLLWLSGTAGHEPLPILLEYITGLRASTHLTSPLREYYLALREIDMDYLEALSALQVLVSLTNEFAGGNEKAKLEDLVRLVRLNRELSRPITDESWFVSGEQAVQLMTVHKAKGLEFDSVFLLDAIEDTWQPRHAGRKPPANLPLQPYGEQYDDYIRLLYVAVTRAKRSLIVSSYYTDGQGRQLLPTPLINSVLPAQIITSETVDEPIAVLESALTWPRLETSSEQLLLKGRLENYTLNATSLIQFLDLTTGGPQYFLERQLLRLPETISPRMAYGTAIHAALQTAQQLANQDRFSLTSVIQRYSEVLREQTLLQNDLQRYDTHGRQILQSLFKDKDFMLPKGGHAEIALNNVELGEAQLGGKLDHLLLKDGKLVITDYKTGPPLRSFTTRDQTKVVKAWRQRTQLLFYALLSQQSGRYRQASHYETQIIYVEAEQPNELVLGFVPGHEDLEHLKVLISVVWKHILELDFPDTSAYNADMAGITAFCQDLVTNAK